MAIKIKDGKNLETDVEIYIDTGYSIDDNNSHPVNILFREYGKDVTPLCIASITKDGFLKLHGCLESFGGNLQLDSEGRIKVTGL